MNAYHLVTEPMRCVQEVSGFGQQHEILNPFSLAHCVIALDHIAESLNLRSCVKRGPGFQGMRMIAQ